MEKVENGKNKHFILKGYSQTETFKRPSSGFTSTTPPARDRKSHGSSLMTQLEAIKPIMDSARQAQMEAGLEGGFGLQVEFESFPDIELAFESLSQERYGIELLNVRHDESTTSANVFVPDGQLKHFEGLIRDYLEEKRDRNGKPRDHKALIHTISQIRAASLKALWTDDPAAFPLHDDEHFWWEVWLPVRKDRTATLDTFKRLAVAQNFEVAPGKVEFPERTVILVKTSKMQMQSSMMTINCIAELRRAKETAEFFDSLRPEEQREWASELLARARFSKEKEDTPSICLLDTGVNNGHPLVKPCLSDSDMHTVEPSWGVYDDESHGTGMAGLAIYGDLTEPLDSKAFIEIGHRLESVKILPRDGANHGNGHHHAYLTAEAVARPEISSPFKKRVFGMAVSAKDSRDRGRPSAWSAMIDKLASDVDDYNASPRLMIVCAGNVDDLNAWEEYPHSNSTDGIHDPGQAWNALTVGAFTDLDTIPEPDCGAYTPVAAKGGLSPFSTTSATWQSLWPLKPDVVFEGGNAAKDPFGAVSMSGLSLLTTNHQPERNLFTTFRATSAATALASRMAARVMAAYPGLWPESVRGLMVHSAQWTENMIDMFLPKNGKATKKDYSNLVRHCGFGVPDIERALWSVFNSLTLISEETLHPFIKKSSTPTLRDMNLHTLPWPLEELESLGELQVEMRVTLSYFIDPNPSSRGFRSRYRYESHGLRFDVKRPLENENDFRSRINGAAMAEEEGTTTNSEKDPNWLIGANGRHKGSIHSDVWRGTAADLASRGILAVFPTSGWWKTRPALKNYDKKARYSLIVSIHAPETEVDLYTAISNKIKIPITTGV